jgi:peroxiredoxin
MKKFWTPFRIISTVIVLSLVVVFASCNSNDTQVQNSSSPSQPQARNNPTSQLTEVPASVMDAQLQTANGTTIKLSNYSGKVLLVNLWATWCGPCRMETPELVRLHKEFQARGVEMVGLSTENPEGSAASVREFVRAFNVDYQVGWATPEVALTLMQGRESIPQSFVITRDGRILKRFIGFSPTATPPQLRQALEDALAGKG